MIIDISHVFIARFGRNLGPVLGQPEIRRPPEYGVDASFENATIHLKLTFRCGRAYCCAEPSCHLRLSDGKGWDRLRQDLAVAEFELPPKLELLLLTVVEPGALFFDLSRPDPSCRGWYAFASAKGHEFEGRYVEG